MTEYDQKALARLERKLRKGGNKHDCWMFTAHLDKDGYGTFYYRGRNDRAHRVAYMLYFGIDYLPTEGPDGRRQEVCHLCNNKKCCNPNHLLFGKESANQNQRRICAHAFGPRYLKQPEAFSQLLLSIPYKDDEEEEDNHADPETAG